MLQETEGEPLFSDNEDETPLNADAERGAYLNEIDGQADDLFDVEELLSEATVEIDGEAISCVNPDVVPQETLDMFTLATEELNPDVYRKTNEYCLYDRYVFNTDDYMDAVFQLCSGQWIRARIYAADYERFKMRDRCGWKGIDTLYDAYLVLEKRPRRIFDDDKFHTMFPDFEDTMKEM